VRGESSSLFLFVVVGNAYDEKAEVGEDSEMVGLVEAICFENES
jgi:hypothetical protein